MKLSITIVMTVVAYLTASGCRRYMPKTSLRTWLVPVLYVLAWSMALLALAWAPGYSRLCAEVLAISSVVYGAAFMLGWLLPSRWLEGRALHVCRGIVAGVIAGPLWAIRFDQVYSLPNRVISLPDTTLGQVGSFVLLGLPGFVTLGLLVSIVSYVNENPKRALQRLRTVTRVHVALACWLLFFTNWYVAGLFDIYKATQQGNTALLNYVRFSRHGVLRSREYDGSSVSHYLRHPDMVTFFADAGVDLDARILHGGDSGRTALHLAANEGNLEVVRTLLDHGVEIDARDPAHWTPLGRALHENQIGIAILLINSGASVDSKDRAGNTPLHWAALQGHREAVAVLLDAGAPLNLMNGHGSTPMDVASDRSPATLALLKESGCLTSDEIVGEGTPVERNKGSGSQ